VKNLKNEAKTKRTEAQKALNEWKNLLQTSSLNDERRNKFIADSIAFENQKRVAAEQNRQEKERLEAENRRIENERQRLAKKEAEINNRPIQLTESPPSKTLANGLVVGRNYCCNSDGNFLYCIRSETISQQELNEIKRQRDNNVYREENDRTLIRCLEQGEEVQLLGEKGGWFKVYDIQSQRTGYMSKKMGSRISLTSCD
jgi:flagellar biosynthesis GTPase FlhF